MNKSIKVGIIGFGKRGKTHLRSYSAIENIEIVGICDIIKLTPIEKISVYRNYKEMLEKTNLDAVSICLPTYLHYKTALDCLNKGINVLLEKPMVTSTKEANKLAALAKRNKKVLMVGYNFKHDYKIKKIKSITSTGKLGVILMVRARQAHNWGGQKPFGWLLDKQKSGGGTIIDNATHYLNLLEFLIGKINEVHAFSNNLSFNGNVEDNAIISLKFDNKAIGLIETSWGDASGRTNQLIIWGSKAVIELTESNEGTKLTLKKYTSEKNNWNRSVIQNLYIPKGIEQLNKKVNRDNSKILAEDNTISTIRQFITKIRTQTEFTTISDIRTVKIVNAVYASLKQKRNIKV